MKNDWIKIKNYYIHHSISLEDLAKKYKVSISTVTKRSSIEKWKELKKEKMKEIDRKVAEKIIEKEIDKKIKANELHTELYNKSLKVANKLLDMYMEELEDPNIKKKKLANAYNLDFVTKSIANAQKGQRLSLNIEKEEIVNTEPEVNVISGIDLKDI